MATEQAKLIVTYADNDMNGSVTAKRLYYSVFAVDYKLREIAISTGINPKTFHGLIKLYRMAKRLLKEAQ